MLNNFFYFQFDFVFLEFGYCRHPVPLCWWQQQQQHWQFNIRTFFPHMVFRNKTGYDYRMDYSHIRKETVKAEKHAEHFGTVESTTWALHWKSAGGQYRLYVQ